MTITKREQDANKLINEIEEFPPLPSFISRILLLNADPESSLEDICRVVEAEVSLASAVIKMANSSFFGLRHQVSSIPHALAMLGRNELINLVLARVLFQAFKGVKEKKEHVASLRLHCFQCGLISRYLAQKAGYEAGDAFIAGLVHDIGKIIIYLAFSEEKLEEVYNSSSLDHDDISSEGAQLGIDHTVLGAMLLASWGFPEQLQATVKYHHQPDLAGEQDVYPLLIHAADILVHIRNLPRGDQQQFDVCCQQLFTEPARRLVAQAGIRITAENLNDLLEDIDELFSREGDLEKMFG